MNYLSYKWTKIFGKSFFGTVFVLVFVSAAFAQKAAETKAVLTATKTVKVTQLDAAGLKSLLKPNGKPLLVNFWATWCEPCREEFPDLVKIDHDFRGKIDFFTVSLDDSAEIATSVPRFLESMRAEMPAYLLKVPDEGEVISAVAKDWQGGLPFTILYNEKGEIAYFKQGKIKIETLKAEIEKLGLPTQK